MVSRFPIWYREQKRVRWSEERQIGYEKAKQWHMTLRVLIVVVAIVVWVTHH